MVYIVITVKKGKYDNRCVRHKIADRRNNGLDKKQMLEERKPKSWLKSVSAFANGEGGALIFGIADDGEVVGLQEAQHDAEIISEQIKQRWIQCRK